MDTVHEVNSVVPFLALLSSVLLHISLCSYYVGTLRRLVLSIIESHTPIRTQYSFYRAFSGDSRCY